MITCACHGRKHREENVTHVRPVYADGDPTPTYPGGPLYLCDVGLRQRERRRTALEKARKAHPKGRAA